MSQNNSDRLNTRVSAIALASFLALSPLAAEAAGLGRLTVLSALGQPLRAEIELSATVEELNGMTAKVASADAFKQAGIDYFGALGSVRFSIDKRPNGQPVVRMTSDRPISEPFVDMLVELNWSSGRLVREYTFLLDPPEAQPLAAVAEPVVPPVTAALPAPVRPAPAPVQVAPRPVAPAAAPVAPVRPVEKAPAAAEGEVYRVKRGDTLSKIAESTKPEGVSLEQMLVGLVASNRDAFIGGNMNRLKSGRILQVPSKDQVAAISQDEAVKEVRAQAADWNAYRRKLAAVAAEAPAVEAEARQEAAGKVTAKVEEPVKPVEAPKDQVKVSKARDEAVKGAAAPVAPSEEDKVAAERAARESQERVAALEKNVADLKKLSEMKNGESAAAQTQAAPGADGAQAPAAAPAAAVDAPAPVAAAPAEAKPKPAPRPKPPVVVPEEEESFLGSLFGNPAVLGGLGAILAAIGGLVVYRRRKAQGGESAGLATGTLSQPSLGANSVFRATGGQSVDTSNVAPASTDFSQSGAGAIDTDDVDPVAEAEVYMAYGRDAQAEEILLDALQKDPKRVAIHAKLLEIYSNRKSVKQFETLATELYAQTGGKGAEWSKAVELGVKLDPSNPLYAGSGASAASAASGAAAGLAGGLAAGAFGAAAGADSLGAGSPSAAPVADSADTGAVDLGLDVVNAAAPAKSAFEFDLGSFGAAPAATDELASAEASSGGRAADDFLASLSASTNALDLSGLTPPAAPPVPVAEPEPLPAADDGGLNFEITSLNLGGEPKAAPEPVPAPEELALNDGMKLDFDFGTASQAMPEASDVDIQLTSTAFEPTALDGGLDLAADNAQGIDFDQTLLVTPGIAAEMAAGGGAAVSEQEVATKIDLAKAYEEMGDAEGARELLQEVLAEGSPAQREAAQAMIDRLG